MLDLNVRIVNVGNVEGLGGLSRLRPLNMDRLADLHSNEGTRATDTGVLQRPQAPLKTQLFVFGALVEFHLSVSEHITLVSFSFFNLLSLPSLLRFLLFLIFETISVVFQTKLPFFFVIEMATSLLLGSSRCLRNIQETLAVPHVAALATAQQGSL